MPAVSQNFPAERIIGADILQRLPRRAHDSHKGDFGSVGVLGGAAGMLGAVLLASRAALHLGAGRVYASCIDGGIAIDLSQAEIMSAAPAALLAKRLSVLAVGPGMGRSAAAIGWLDAALRAPTPLVLDADALTLLAESPALRQLSQQRVAPTLLTPHPGEAARLLGGDAASIQRDRLGAAQRIAREYRAALVLKGAHSVCVAPDGDWRVNPTGNPGLASAGMGDVLTGMLAALLAQGVPGFEALQLATYLHGAAADALVANGTGPVGLTASEVLLEARRVLNRRA
jgi:hydroxyethylthiazole kinase-like uncharacterized protein yjeF